MQNALKNLVLIATPEAANLLAQSIATDNFNIYKMSFIDIEPIAVGDKIFDSLDNSDILIFNSANGIKNFCQILPSDKLIDSPIVWTMGKNTAQSLQKWFANVYYPQKGNDSEALLAELAQLNINLQGQKVTLIKGEGGREFLAPTLTKMGAIVNTLNVYRRVANLIKVKNLLELINTLPNCSLVFLSAENINVLSTAFREDQISYQSKKMILSLPVFVQHWKIKHKALECGFKDVYLADNLLSIPKLLEVMLLNVRS